MRRTFFAFFVLVALVGQSVAQAALKISPVEKKFAEGVTAKQLSDYLYFVASDEMEGRDTPSRGLDTTAKFIAMNLSRWGFKPAGDDGTYFQKIGLRRDMVDPVATSLKVGDQVFAYNADVARASGSAPISAPVVFAGNGWMIKSKGLNPYANIDIKGKLVAVYSEGPMGARNLVPMPAGTTLADLAGVRGTDWADPVTYARANGAAGILVLPSQFVTENWTSLVQNVGRGRLVVDKLVPVSAPTQGGQSMSVLFASPKLANALFAGEQGNPLTGAANSFALDPSKVVTFTPVTKPETSWTQNVVAVWEGSDPKMKDEMVAVGAHYDHIGNAAVPGSQCRAVAGDNICNGADDDGSGTVSVLSIAEALAKAPQRPRRSVLFVWHCGEEKGLWGSEYFNKFPTVDVKKVIAQLNIDMIGRGKPAGDTDARDKDLSGPDAIYVIGKDMMSSTLGNLVSGVNSGYLKLDYDTRYDDPKDPNRFFFRSDHFNYALNGIPITFWFDGVHVDYHQPGDEPQKIDYNKMEKVARTVAITLWKLTDMKDRPKIDKQLPPELTQR
jgi:Zn-dependent M28 family amino/carboxypeptidase